MMCAPGPAKKGFGVRKVLLCGAAFAATCISAVAVPTGALATTTEPTPTPTGTVTVEPSPTVPSADPRPTGPTGAPSSPTPSPGDSGTPDAAPTPTPPSAGSGSVVSAQGVMVTPRPPRQATYAYGPGPRQRIDAYWRPVTAPKKQRAPKTGAEQRDRDGGPSATPSTTPSATPSTAPGDRRRDAPAPKARPAVLMLHGGYWLRGDKSSWKYFARRLTNQGFVVFAANYRLAETAEWPAQRNDAGNALAFVKKNAKRWNVDPERVVVLGSSAGGMLATQLGAYGEGGERVRGVIALSPVNTPYLAYQDGARPTASPAQRRLRGAVTELIRCAAGSTGRTADPSCWRRIEDADSASHASADDAPMLLMHSVGDFVPPAQSTALASALRAVNVPVTVRTIPGDAHGSSLLNDPNVYPTILSWLKARTR